MTMRPRGSGGSAPRWRPSSRPRRLRATACAIVSKGSGGRRIGLENPEATDHANRVRDACVDAADLMAAVQQSRWSDVSELRNEIEQVRLGAAAIDGDRPLLDQTAAMRSSFDRAAAAIRRMAQQT